MKKETGKVTGSADCYHRMTTDSSSCWASATTRSNWASLEMGCNSIDAGESSSPWTDPSSPYLAKASIFPTPKWVLIGQKATRFGDQAIALIKLKLGNRNGFFVFKYVMLLAGDNCRTLDMSACVFFTCVCVLPWLIWCKCLSIGGDIWKKKCF